MTISLGMPTMPPTAPDGVGNLRGTERFQQAARHDLKNSVQRHNLRMATHTIRDKRARVVGEIDDWQQLRDAGSAIKRDVMARMPELLEQFEEAVTARGGHVHWARDAKEANEIITGLVKETGEKKVVKIKSMATMEIGLNDALKEAGIEARETDLAELIVQLGHDRPSHIVVPAIHRNRAEIRDIFIKEMPNTDESLTDNPADLAEASRLFLRKQFMDAKVAISGANFGIAETGTLSIVESEGNGRMCLTLPETLISVMGIEKLLPTFKDLEVFLQLLPRSSTGERMNPYTSLWSGTTEGDGPKNFHIVLIDNGRTHALANAIGREALKCIRCSACLNVCPVYERAGGHAYGSTYPGPIGAILTPQLAGMESAEDPNASLPYASSLCGACFEVCPVEIDIPSALLELRHQKIEHHRPKFEGMIMSSMGLVFGNKQIWNFSARAAVLGRALGWPKGKITSLPGFLSGWSNVRDTAIPPKKSFRAWFASEEGKRTLAAARKEGIPDNSFRHADHNTGNAAEVKVSEPGERKTSSKPLEHVLDDATSKSQAHDDSSAKNSSKEGK
ncbi:MULTISPECIES: LutB/LldF family L-lactate oxidation iron-sulfur protein [Corynebacterium]|uniref:LutB/LldF family L-lactate oxidation iron-sulfur protein n=1 Tax=Corynebacterium TaxID=1716 RepID=UPI0006195E4A|nr:LutB/LldF family L-lactate oxidation iron-sulfur protein [Corynebacterium parakroppenstedtii]MCZ9302705.1 LutB/LldF family L-lactate oxidation iron-sulfur protein [Corynebacterium sp. c24U_166]MDU3197420.1 LutB/LldF family L-lactate oxidation iron-sulfur protein [Corynebacterium kroppenstedtii]MBY0788024.1 iron-sulfur cluster-binding protein [Corynebacterium parakroppenstedtii]MBY0796144.1 iron-sulfur cluster-binding protein [Corynebacterium parakroppenstedtii]MCF6778463.1 LutB/LldF family 